MTIDSKKEATSQQKTSNPSVLRSAAAMSAATLSSRILGMFRDMVMTALFPRIVSDAWVVAFRLPNLFRRILGEGSLAASFVPLYVEALNVKSPHGKTQDQVQAVEHLKNQTEAQLFSAAVFSMLTVVTATLSVLGVIFMPWIIGHLVAGEGYMQVPGKYELTVILARIMFSYLFLVTSYAFYMSLANAHKIFFLPAFAPAGFNFLTIVMAFLPDWSVHGDQMAWGVIAGGVLQLFMAAYPLIKLGAVPRLTLHWSVPRVKKFFQVVLPSMLGMSVAQLLGILNVSFASHLPQGTHSYIYLADRLLEFPQSLLSVSLGVALLPTLSEMWVRGQRVEFLQTAQRHIRLLMVLSLPAAVGLFVLAEPIVRVIFARGQFGEHDVAMTSQVVMIYTIILVVSGLHRVTVPCFYAIKNTWLPATNSAICLVIHFFVAGWATDHYGLSGLVGATAFTGTLNLTLLLVSYKYIFGDLGMWSFVRSVVWLVPALAIMGFATKWVYADILQWISKFHFTFHGAATLTVLLPLVVAIVVAVGLFFSVNALVRHPESNEILDILRRRVRR